MKPEIRKGILPSILAALMEARAATRAALKQVPADQLGQRAVLDSRQKALKLTANALYGFTGGVLASPGFSSERKHLLSQSESQSGTQIDLYCN